MENWKEIEEHKGYFVSDLGRIKSYRRGEPRILKMYDRHGYKTVRLDNKFVVVHRLVANAFIPNPNNLPQINHKNEIKEDNRVENLEWCTASYNVRYGTCLERRTAKLKKRVRCMESGEIFFGLKEAAKVLGCDFSHIAKCCRGTLATHKGFHFEYI